MKINLDYLKKLILYVYGSQKNFANHMGITEKTVSSWLTGKSDIPMKKLDKILNFIEYDIVVDRKKLFNIEN